MNDQWKEYVALCGRYIPSDAKLLKLIDAQDRVVKAADHCRKMDEESCRAREGDGLTEAQWDAWWDAHCKAHDEAYDALDAALKEPS